MTEPAASLPFTAEPARWLLERGREARHLAALATEEPQRAALLAVAEAIDHALQARGLPTVDDLDHWDDPPLSPEESAAYLQTLETGQGPWRDSLAWGLGSFGLAPAWGYVRERRAPSSSSAPWMTCARPRIFLAQTTTARASRPS